MSVILFSKSEVYQEMADSYEGLKHLVREYGDAINDEKFYKSLRRLYFANVATYLCQYHDDNPLSDEELKSVDTFMEIEGKRNEFKTNTQDLHEFLSAWGSLQYNLVTNDGEEYEAKEAKAYIEKLVRMWTKEIVERVASGESNN